MNRLTQLWKPSAQYIRSPPGSRWWRGARRKQLTLRPCSGARHRQRNRMVKLGGEVREKYSEDYERVDRSFTKIVVL